MKRKAYADKYRTLNDAAIYGDGYEKGGTEIWYMRPENAREMMNRPFRSLAKERPDLIPNAHNLATTHVLLGKIQEKNLDKIFGMMQGEMWSPEGEARSLIQSKGLRHTSMSVGDVIKIGSKHYYVDFTGFTEVSKEQGVMAKTHTAAARPEADVVKGPAGFTAIAYLANKGVEGTHTDNIMERLQQVGDIMKKDLRGHAFKPDIELRAGITPPGVAGVDGAALIIRLPRRWEEKEIIIDNLLMAAFKRAGIKIRKMTDRT